MDFFYEGIDYKSSLEFKLFLQRVSTVGRHLHNDFEILFVLKGNIYITVNDEELVLTTGNIYLINPNVLHSIKAEKDNLMLVIQIPRECLIESSKNNFNIDFRYTTFNDMQTTEYKTVAKMLAEMTMLYVNKDDRNLLLKSNLYKLMYIITQHESTTMRKNTEDLNKKDLVRLLEMIKYAKESFSENKTLVEYAEIFDLTPQYFSNFFKKNYGDSYMQYINELRVEKARELLHTTNKSMAEISMECGFSSIKSFNTMFKSKTGSTPSEERKKDVDVSDIKSSNNFNYLEILEKDPLKELKKYLDFNVENNVENNTEEFEITRRVRIDLEKEPQKIRHTWKNLITVATASHILDAEIQKMLKETQKEIGFKYIRFHGIFNDDMLVVDRKPNKELDFNFNKIGMLVDFLLSIGLKPFFELGFMPTKMASGDRTVFYSKNNITMPKKIEEWNSLVRAFVSYLKNKYGIREVSTWYFEFWNEPELVNLFGFENSEDYFLFYKETFNTIKELDKNIKIGGPSIILVTLKNKFFNRYVEYCVKNMCVPDFFTVHSYPSSGDTEVVDNINQETLNSNFEEFMLKHGISENEDYLRDNLKVTKEIIKNTKVFSNELYVTEWNSTPWHRDLCSDTTYKSAYIVKNICSNMDTVDGLGYWMLSDYSHEIFPSKNLFHGGLGLFTYNGIKKAGYNAYKLLSKLGDECIDKGKTHYVTKDGDNYQILLFNYCHYNKMYRDFDTSIINLTNRKDVFEGNLINIQLIIDNVESSLYKTKITRINSESGSAYDEWLKMGAPETLMFDDVNYLKGKAQPSYTITNNEISLNFEMQVKMEKNEVVLIELVKK